LYVFKTNNIMDKKSYSNFENWSIEKGDYQRDETSRWSYQKKIIRKERIKKAIYILLYLVSVTVVTYLILS